MSAPYTNIEAAFVTRLRAYPTLPQHPTGVATNGYPESVAWDNKSFKPSIGTPFIVPTMMEAEPFQAEIGTYGINRHTGYYQISIFCPAGQGHATINTLRDGLIDHFKRNTRLTYGGVTVRVVKVSTSKGPQETDWTHKIVKVDFTADAPN